MSDHFDPRGLRLDSDREEVQVPDGQTGPLPPNWRSIGQVANDVVRSVEGLKGALRRGEESSHDASPKDSDDAVQKCDGN